MELRPPRASLPDEWDQVTRGELEREAAVEGYRDNLVSALESVGTLRNNVDAETAVITSDHGEAFGEYDIYGNPDVPLNCLITVPWVETTATDSGTYRPPGYEMKNDTALYLDREDLPVSSSGPDYTLAALRTDQELALPTIEEQLSPPAVVDDISVTADSFEAFVDRGARARKIYTDRLHGAILGALLETPVRFSRMRITRIEASTSTH